MERLTSKAIRGALEALAGALPAGDSPRELWVVGGAALVLLYGARETTKDVDAFTLDAGASLEVRAAAARVASRLGLPEDWLNDGAKGYLHGLAPGELLFDSPGLRVRSVAVPQLLAMKLSAWRDDLDVGDARLLLSKLSGDKASIWSQVEPYLVPGRQLKAQYAFDDVWEADRGSA
jgi:predicted nucleotidyltransferase